jgi:hypothetical protein
VCSAVLAIVSLLMVGFVLPPLERDRKGASSR